MGKDLASKFELFNDPEGCRQLFEVESSSQPEHNFEEWRFTNNFIISNKNPKVWYHYSEVAWAYIRTNTRRIWFIIPTGTGFYVNIHMIGGEIISVYTGFSFHDNTEREAKLLKYLYGKTPFALFGYNQEIEKVWRTDFYRLVSEVLNRRSRAIPPIFRTYPMIRI